MSESLNLKSGYLKIDAYLLNLVSEVLTEIK